MSSTSYTLTVSVVEVFCNHKVILKSTITPMKSNIASQRGSSTLFVIHRKRARAVLSGLQHVASRLYNRRPPAHVYAARGDVAVSRRLCRAIGRPRTRRSAPGASPFVASGSERARPGSLRACPCRVTRVPNGGKAARGAACRTSK